MAPVFFAFRVMVGVGMLMLAVSWACAWALRRQGTPTVWHGRALVAMTFSGWVATLAGWYVTEIGRQPWLVTGVLKTHEAASAVPAGAIGLTLAMYLAVYAGLLLAYVTAIFALAKKAGSGARPPVDAAMPPPAGGLRPIAVPAE